jgi:hypothetical protein
MEHEPVKSDLSNTIEDSSRELDESTSVNIEGVTSLEQIKENLRLKYPLEDILNYLGSDGSISLENKDLVIQRYENCLDCAAKVQKLYQDTPKEVRDNFKYSNIFSMSFPGRISSSFAQSETSSPFIETYSRHAVLGSGSFSSFEKTIEFNPDIVVVTPSSAILPSIMVKKFFEVYSGDHPHTSNPFFLLPRFKSKGTVEGKELEDFINDVKEQFDPLDRESHDAAWMKKWAPLQEGDDLEKVYEQYLKNDAYRSLGQTIKKICDGKDEVKLVILDEFVSVGRTIAGTIQAISLIFNTMKDRGEISADVELKIEILNLNAEGLYESGNGWLKNREGGDDRWYSKLKSGALPIHQMKRKFFEIVGEHFAKEFEILQELKKREDKRAQVASK